MLKKIIQWLRNLFGMAKAELKTAEEVALMEGYTLRHHVHVTVRDPHISLWQSAMEEGVHRKLGNRPRRGKLLHHPLMQVVNEHAARLERKETITAATQPVTHQDHFDTLVHASHLFFQRSHARIKKDKVAEAAAHAEIQKRSYEDGDPMFLTIIPIFEAYYLGGLLSPIYRDWTKEGKNNLEYGVIPWELPAGSKVGIIGDWGTGMNDAEALLTDLVRQVPDVIVHLGDIYYAGTEHQAQETFLNVFDRVFQAIRPGLPRIPVFNMAGNHDYYARGTGFYQTIDEVNLPLGNNYTQPASYFCLRTADKSWQILGSDTGVNDHRWTDTFNPFYKGPGLEASEVDWHKDKLTDAPKNAAKTLFLSHHQLFSQYSVGSLENPHCILNEQLLEIFAPYFTTKISAWMWGHEHSFAMFNNGLYGLQRGRLIGSSAYEQAQSSKPAPNASKVPSQPYTLGALNNFYNHAYALIQFPQAGADNKDLAVTYYQLPSWGADQDNNPPSSVASVLATETFPFNWEA
jgi:hypothetical protein